MNSLVTQGLVGLVFVLSVALWSKSSSPSSSASQPAGSAAAKKSKKKKRAAGPPVASDAASSPHTSPIPEPAPAPAPQPLAQVPSNGSAHQHTQPKANGRRGKKEGGDKMTLAAFAGKTNEERVEELERAARGDAGDKDVGGDMVDKELQPEVTYKKVARIGPTAAQTFPPLATTDEGWKSVGGKAKTPAVLNGSKATPEAPSNNAWASSNPFAALPGSGAEVPRSNGRQATTAASVTTSATPRSGTASSAAAQTKKQRQNAAKTQAKKAEKEAMEADRLATLAHHKKQVEAERMKEFFKKQPNATGAPASSQWSSSGGANKAPAKPMAKATINEKGSLVWD